MTGARDPDKSAVGERECPSPPRRLARRLLVILIALLAVGWSASFLYNHSGGARLAAARREAQKLGLTLSYDDFLAKYPPPLEEENAAQFYEAAIATLLYVGYKPESDYVPIVSRALAGEPEQVDERLARAIRDSRRLDSDPRIPMPDYMLEASAVYVANRAAVIDLIHKGAALPRCRYHLQWDRFNTLLPHLTRVRSMVRMMAVAARVDAEQNRPHDAAVKIGDMLSLAVSTKEDYFCVSSLVEMACVSITLTDGLTRAAARTLLSNDDLLVLQQDLERFDANFSLERTYEGELVMWAGISDELVSGRVSLRNFLSTYSDSINAGSPHKYSRFIYRLPPLLIAGRLKAEEAIILEHISRHVARVDEMSRRLPEGEQSDTLVTEAESNDFPIALSGLCWTPRVPLSAACTRAKLRSAAAAMAALRFRNDHGRLPASLDELVPEYMAEMPVDPFSGKPLLFRLLDDGLIIYSISENRTDDAGKGYILGRGTAADGDDHGFSIWTGSPEGEKE